MLQVQEELGNTLEDLVHTEESDIFEGAFSERVKQLPRKRRCACLS